MEKEIKKEETNVEQEEISLDDLAKVTGAGMHDVHISGTKDIDKGIASRS